MNRKIYLLLSTISFLFPIAIGLFTKTPMVISILITYLIYFLVQIILFAIMTIGFDDDDIRITPLFGFLTIFSKRIYYSDMGYFYTYLFDGRINIFTQNLLTFRKISDVGIYGDIESIKYDIKNTIDSEYSKIKKKDNKLNEYKKWDGYVDVKSKRDEKLKKIL